MTAASIANLASFSECPDPLESRIEEEVSRGMTAHPKELSPWLFYDSAGSRLFEEITELPEYYLTRTERDIFAAHAAEIVSRAAGDRRLEVFELGAGSATKTGLLLQAAVRRQEHVTYRAIDVSPTVLREAKVRLEAEFPGVAVEPTVEDYTLSMNGISSRCNRHGSNGMNGPVRKLVLSIGSSIGNFHPDEAAAILRRLRGRLMPGDELLLGVDMVKAPELLLAAYNDAAGITARFNKNVLIRINHELDGDFNLSRFRHQAVWNPAQSRIEMHLKSLCEHDVSIGALGLKVRFKAGESIHTENSYKFTRARLRRLLASAGFSPRKLWTDEHRWFSLQLAAAA